MAIIPGESGLGGSRMSPFWILLEPRMMEVVLTTGVMMCKASVKSSPRTNRHLAFTGLCPSCHATNSIRELREI